jgi:hypothetical protein
VIADESPPSLSMSNGLTTHPRQIHVNAYTPTYAFTTYSV